jgi:DNA-binding transcriptional ArsR family regulator
MSQVAVKSKRTSRQAQPAELQLCTPGQARALLQPMRVELLRLLAEPRGIRELSQLVQASPQKVHYHLKSLEAAGLIRRVATRKVRALTESIYQAVAESFGPSPELLAMLGGGNRARDTLSKGYMLALAEDLVADAAKLALSIEAEGAQHPTLSVAAYVELADLRRRDAFLKELQGALLAIAEKYGVAEATPDAAGTYKLVLACYPQPDSAEIKPG